VSEVDIALRAGEIAISAAAPLVRLLVEEMMGGKSEEEALRAALTRLAARESLEPVLPKVRAMFAERRARDAEELRTARGEDDTKEVPLDPDARLRNGG
jgi:hypothetical protein